MKHKILLIEDNEQNRYLITYILEKHGYEVFQARDGHEGIELAKRVQPALIILDIQLPLMDGFAVAQRLKKNDNARRIPIIAVTAKAMKGDRERVMEAGCNDCLYKPINPETLTAKVAEWLVR